MSVSESSDAAMTLPALGFQLQDIHRGAVPGDSVTASGCRGDRAEEVGSTN